MKNVYLFELTKKLSKAKKAMEAEAFKDYNNGFILSVELAKRILFINDKSYKIYKYGCEIDKKKKDRERTEKTTVL